MRQRLKRAAEDVAITFDAGSRRRAGGRLSFPFIGVIGADLSANFASRARQCVNVPIRLSGTNRREQLRKVMQLELL